jgi:hypothetical protein
MMAAGRLTLWPHEPLRIAKRMSHTSLAIHHLSTYNFVCSSAKSEDLWNMDLFRLLVDETNWDAELFWDHRGRYTAPSVPFETALKVIFPMDTMEYPTFRMIERLDHLTKTSERLISPKSLANYLGFESLESVYPTLEDSTKHDITRLAINSWGHFSGWNFSDDAWEQTLRAMFVAGIKLKVLYSQDTKSNSNVSRDPGSDIQGVVEMIRQFVRPYAWQKAVHQIRHIEARDTLKGFQYLVSRTDYLGIKLETGQHYGRLEVCFDEDFMRTPNTIFIKDPCIDPHTLSLYYDDSLSTWVMWNAMYEEYCGDFWDLLEHPERTMPGTWVD